MILTNFQFINVEQNDVILYQVINSNFEPILWKEFIENMRFNEIFLDEFLKILKNVHFDQYFLEFNGTNNKLDGEIIFGIIKTNKLSNVQNYEAFKNQFIKIDKSRKIKKSRKIDKSKIIDFMNLSNDALLIVPRPVNLKKYNYSNISTFTKTADLEIQKLLWKHTFNKFKQFVKLNQPNKIWLSTHGQGVSWLHIRISLLPKYYNLNLENIII